MSPDSDRRDEPDERDLAGRDPVEVLRAILAIEPEDAGEARKDATAKAEHKSSKQPGKASEGGRRHSLRR